MKIKIILLACIGALFVSCRSLSETELPTRIPTAVINQTIPFENTANGIAEEIIPAFTQTPRPTSTLIPSATFIPSPTQIPTATDPAPTLLAVPPTISLEEAGLLITPTETIEPTATYWPTVTRQVLSAAESAGLASCQNRTVPPDFLVFATQQFTLPESYIPPNLVSTTDYFDSTVTLDDPQFIRQTILEPLQRMIAEMHALGLRPTIISAYRSFQEQALAWHWWNSQYPGRVAILSARPGYSEHQLGTTIDFGSPEIRNLFHVDFAGTSEGVWLTNNAYRFGFTLSYPVDSYDVTGYKWEPWHFRYVGEEMAEYLFNSGQILTSWQIANLPPPCIP